MPSRQVIGTQHYVGTERDALNFKADQIIDFIELDGSGQRAKGKYGEQEGWFPVAFVKELPYKGKIQGFLVKTGGSKKEKRKSGRFGRIFGGGTNVEKSRPRKESGEMCIGAVSTVQHVGHLGFDDKAGFQARNLPPEIQTVFNDLNKLLSSNGLKGITKKEAQFLMKATMEHMASSEKLKGLPSAKAKKERGRSSTDTSPALMRAPNNQRPATRPIAEVQASRLANSGPSPTAKGGPLSPKISGPLLVVSKSDENVTGGKPTLKRQATTPRMQDPKPLLDMIKDMDIEKRAMREVLEAKIQAEHDRAKKYSSKYKKVCKKRDEYMQRLRDKDTKTKMSDLKYTEVQSEVADLKDSLKEAEEGADVARKELAKTKKTVTTKDGEITDLTDQISTLKDELSRDRLMISSLKESDKTGDVQVELEKMKKQSEVRIEELQERMKQERKKMKLQEAELNAANDATAGAVQQARDLKKSLKAVETKLDNLTKENKQTDGRVTELENSKTRADEQLAKAHDELKKATDQLSKSKKNAEKTQRDLESYRTKAIRLERSLAVAMAANDDDDNGGDDEGTGDGDGDGDDLPQHEDGGVIVPDAPPAPDGGIARRERGKTAPPAATASTDDDSDEPMVRNHLLDAIRSGKSLKTVDKSKLERPAPGEGNGGIPADGLLGALASALLNRRANMQEDNVDDDGDEDLLWD